jgi:dipeptidyl aminopeptidase/acylaminoacyl peptidase
VRDNIDYIDTSRSVAAGASYGGFMINWIQGSDLGREFKALVSHDGTFVADAKISTEELWFMEHEFNGTFWGARENYRRFDPSAPERIERFDTPQLVIHNDLDYRLPVAEGLSLFNVLQERGVPSRFVNFPDENHWVVQPENSLVWHQQVLGWLNKYSGVGEENEGAVSLEDTVVPVVDINPPA